MIYLWICPHCGMKNYELLKDVKEYLCRAGDCGEVIKKEELTFTEEE